MSNFLYSSSNTTNTKRMEDAALILSIISIVSFFIIYVSIPCGALAVMFALLSRGGGYQMTGKSIIALCIGITAIVLTSVLYCATFLLLLHTYGSIQGIIDAYSTTYGFNFNP